MCSSVIPVGWREWSHSGKEPTMSSVSLVTGPIHLGLDVHKDSITAAVLLPGEESPTVDKIFHDEASVRRLIDPVFPDRQRLRVC